MRLQWPHFQLARAPGLPLGGCALGFPTRVDISADITGRQLCKRFDAIVLVTGVTGVTGVTCATVPRDLNVPGSEYDGVVPAMDYVPPANRVALGLPSRPVGLLK